MKNLNSDIQASSRIISIINRSKEQYENIINDLENAYVVVNEKLEVIDANKLFSEIRDCYSFRQNLLTYFHKDFIEPLESALKRVLDGDNPGRIELKTINGRIFLFDISPVVVGRLQEGRIIKLLGTDITDLREREGIISDVFRSVSLGLLFINSESKIMPGYSNFTSMILENHELEDADIYETLFYKNQKTLSPDEAQSFEDLRTIFGKDKNEFAIITFLAPKILEIPSTMKPSGKKIIQVTLEPIVEDGLVKRYMMILQDMTDLVNLNPPKLNDDISKMMKLLEDDFDMLQRTFKDIHSLLGRVPDQLKNKLNEEFKGIFHTVKGMLRLMGLNYLGGLVHEMESVIQENQVDESVDYQEIWNIFLVDWSKIKRIFDIYIEKGESADEKSPNKFVASVLEKTKSLPRELVSEFFLSPSLGLSQIDFLKLTEVERSLESLLITNIDKTCLDVDLDMKFIDIKASSSIVQAVQSALIHLLNNSFAHGFPELERPCEVKVHSGSDHHFVTIDYIDNGQGVSIDKMRAKLKNSLPDKTLQIDSLSDQEIAEHIFKSGLSTKEEADEMAGRGEGLSSAVYELERLGGSLKLLNFIEGCHFQIKVPILETSLLSPVVVNHQVLNQGFKIYSSKIISEHNSFKNLFVILYPSLFYQAIKICDETFEDEISLHVKFLQSLPESFDHSDLNEVNSLLRFNQMSMVYNSNENELELLVQTSLSIAEDEVFTKINKIHKDFLNRLETKMLTLHE